MYRAKRKCEFDSLAALCLKSIILIHFNNFKDLCYLTNPAPSFLQHTQTSSAVRWYCLYKKQSHVGQLGRHVKALKSPVTANNFRGLRLTVTGQTFTFAMPMENQVEINRVKQIETDLSHEIQNRVNEKESLTRDIEIPCGTIFILLQSSRKQQLHKYLKICAALHPAVSWAPHLTENR